MYIWEKDSSLWGELDYCTVPYKFSLTIRSSEIDGLYNIHHVEIRSSDDSGLIELYDNLKKYRLNGYVKDNLIIRTDRKKEGIDNIIKLIEDKIGKFSFVQKNEIYRFGQSDIFFISACKELLQENNIDEVVKLHSKTLIPTGHRTHDGKTYILGAPGTSVSRCTRCAPGTSGSRCTRCAPGTSGSRWKVNKIASQIWLLR